MSGALMLAFALFAFSGVDERMDGWGRLFGFGPLVVALRDFETAQHGWPVSNKRPPWADKHDEIDRKHGVAPTNVRTIECPGPTRSGRKTST